jgi:hypothetical protein
MAQSTPPAPRPSRPLGVTILAIILGLVGFVTFLGGIFIAVFSNYAYVVGGTGFFGLSGLAIGILTIIIGLVELVVAIGLFSLRMWALVLGVLVLLISVGQGIYNLIYNGYAGGAYIGLAIGFILIIYLVAVRKHFN